MKKYLEFLRLLICIFIINFISITSYAIDCTNSVVIATSSCTTQPTQLLSSPATYTEVTNLTPNPCCLQACTEHASYSGSNCNCVDGFYISGNSCATCPTCAVTNGATVAVSTDTSNNCVYTVTCPTGYTVSSTCTGNAGGNATCTAKTYNVKLSNYDYTYQYVTATFDHPMPIPITLPTRSGYVFHGYNDSGGHQYYTSSGASAHNWDLDLVNPVLYDSWSACAASDVTSINGTTNAFVDGNTCKYYVTCTTGFQNTTFYNSSTAGSYAEVMSGGTSQLVCNSCSAGYYCPGGERHACSDGTTSNGGTTATSIAACHMQGGSSGTRFCDSYGCFYLPDTATITSNL